MDAAKAFWKSYDHKYSEMLGSLILCLFEVHKLQREDLHLISSKAPFCVGGMIMEDVKICKDCVHRGTSWYEDVSHLDDFWTLTGRNAEATARMATRTAKRNIVMRFKSCSKVQSGG